MRSGRLSCPGRIAQTQQAWDDLLALAEMLGAAVVSERRGVAAFPSNHTLALSNAAVRAADVVLALERNDPAGTLRAALGQGGRDSRADIAWPKLINVSLEPLLINSWVADYQELPRAGLPILSTPHEVVARLRTDVERLVRDDASARRRIEQRMARHHAARQELEAAWSARRERVWHSTPISITRVVAELKTALGERYLDSVLAYMPTAWPSGVWDF